MWIGWCLLNPSLSVPLNHLSLLLWSPKPWDDPAGQWFSAHFWPNSDPVIFPVCKTGGRSHKYAENILRRQKILLVALLKVIEVTTILPFKIAILQFLWFLACFCPSQDSSQAHCFPVTTAIPQDIPKLLFKSTNRMKLLWECYSHMKLWPEQLSTCFIC